MRVWRTGKLGVKKPEVRKLDLRIKLPESLIAMLSSAYRSEYTVHSNGVGLVLEQLGRAASAWFSIMAYPTNANAMSQK